MWGMLMWLLFVRSANVLVVVGLVVASAGFGILAVASMQRRRPRDLDATTP